MWANERLHHFGALLRHYKTVAAPSSIAVCSQLVAAYTHRLQQHERGLRPRPAAPPRNSAVLTFLLATQLAVTTILASPPWSHAVLYVKTNTYDVLKVIWLRLASTAGGKLCFSAGIHPAHCQGKADGIGESRAPFTGESEASAVIVQTDPSLSPVNRCSIFSNAVCLPVHELLPPIAWIGFCWPAQLPSTGA